MNVVRGGQVMNWLGPDLGRWPWFAAHDTFLQGAQVRRGLEPEVLTEEVAIALEAAESFGGAP